MTELSPYLIQRLRSRESAIDSSLRNEEETSAFLEYWHAIRRHSVLIGSALAAAVLVSGIAVFTITPTFTATSVILIEPHPPQVLDIKELMADRPGDDEHDFYKTQYALLMSRSLAAQVIHELALQDNPILKGSSRQSPPGLIGGWWFDVRYWVQKLLSPAPPVTHDAEPSELYGISPPIVDAYLGQLRVDPEFGTRLAKISFTSPDPKLSAAIANAHAGAFVRQGVELRSRANQGAEEFLERKLVELRDRVERSEAALNSYRHDKGIVEFTTTSKHEILLKRLADLNNALTVAETKRVELEAQAALIDKDDYMALPDVVNSAMVQALKSELAKAESDYAGVSSRYSAQYGPLVALKAKLDDTQHRLDDAVGEIARSVELESEAAQARERALREQVDEEKARALALNDASVQDAVLAREVDTNRELYENVLKRMKEMGVAAEVASSNVSLVDRAFDPLSPSSPRKFLVITLSGMLGLLGAVGLAFFIDYLDDTLKGPEETERYLHLPTLALVPDLRRLQNESYRDVPGPSPSSSVDHVAERNGNGLVPGRGLGATAIESFRTIRSQILLSRAGRPPRTVLVTSAVPQEGKSIISVNVALAFAQTGRRVLLIDADLRKARCHELLGVTAGNGLAEVLTGQAEVDEAIVTGDVNGLYFMRAGAAPPDPPELLGSTKMGELLKELGTRFDQIIMDSPPVIPLSDPIMLATHADGVLLVVGPTHKHLVKRTCQRLEIVASKMLGVILNKASDRSPSYYGYYESYSYVGDSSQNGAREDGRHGRVIFD
jgi:capsular exopolysaccharide synthesis family protein